MRKNSILLCAISIAIVLCVTSATVAAETVKQWKKVDIALDTKKLKRFAKFFNRKRASGFVTLLRETNVDKILDEQQRREQFHFTVYLSTDGTELKVMNKAGHPIFLMNGKREATIFLKKLDKKYLQSSLHAMMNTKNMAHRLCFKVPKGMVGTPQKMFYRIIDLGGTGSKPGDFEKKCEELTPQECRRFDLCSVKVTKAKGLLKGMFSKKKRSCEIYQTKNVKRAYSNPWGKCAGDMGTQLSLDECRGTKVGKGSIFVTLKPETVKDNNDGSVKSIDTREMIKYKFSGGYDKETHESTMVTQKIDCFVKGKITTYNVESKDFLYGKGKDALEEFATQSNGKMGIGVQWWDNFAHYVQHSFGVQFEKCMWSL